MIQLTMVDPAWAAAFNSILLIGAMIFGASRVDAFARNLVRTAKGSETRAEKAAAEITRLAAEMEVAQARAQETQMTIAVIGRSLSDELRHIRGEWDRLYEARREMDGEADTPPEDTR
jgi:Sec-independent protein translocase protein TatA